MGRTRLVHLEAGWCVQFYPTLPRSPPGEISRQDCAQRVFSCGCWEGGTNAGHRAGKRPLAAPFIPQISFMQEVHFRRLIRSLSLRLYSLLAPRADQTKAARWPLRPPGLLLPGFQVAGSPLAPAEYDYDAKLRIAPTGLSPASTAASLAAPVRGLQGSHHAVPRLD